MKPWKVDMGLGAACCLVPLLGGVAALTVGSASLAVAGAALLSCADEFTPLAWGLLVLAALVAGAAWWRKRRLARNYCVPGECC